MKHRLSFIALLLSLVIGSCLYGIAIHRFEIFPYQFLKDITTRNHEDVHSGNSIAWSIGIYAGPSPFRLTDPQNIKNPVLTFKDVTDIEAKYVADPFVLQDDSTYYMFFEVLNKKDLQGDIGLATSQDGLNWRYKQIILDEPFHLSYPYIFKWEDSYFMIPESHQDLSVRIYRAAHFPDAWEYAGDLLRGYHYVDPAIVFYQNRWWLFVSNLQNDALNLYYADELMGPWKQHPKSPVVKNDKNISRPGGRLLIFGGHLYRFAQDDFPTYGNQVFAFRITQISTTAYKERIVSDSPILKGSQKGWNANGMHQVDLFHVDKNGWLSVVDGY